MSPDDTDYQSVLDMYAQSGMRNPQISYDANGKPIVVSSNAGLPVDVSTLQDYAATLPADNSSTNSLPTHYPYTPPPTQKAYDVLTGSNGQERYQLFPERIVRSALSLPADVMSGKVATPIQQPAGGSEEDYSSDPLLQRVQDMAALMGGGGVASAEEGALGTAGGKLVQPAVEAAPAEIAPVFHSAVENAVNTSTLKAANPDQWLGTIKNAKGVKPEELDWTGLKDWLGEQSGHSRSDLERMPIDQLDRMAYGHAEGDVVKLNPKDIKIKYPDDLENPQHKFDKQGMKWVKSVDQTEPVKVSIDQDGKFNLEDGHHRWFAANKLGIPVTAEVEKVTGKPIETLLARKPQITKEQVQGYLQQNKVGLGEVNKGELSDSEILKQSKIRKEDWDKMSQSQQEVIRAGFPNTPIKYSKYQLPGGENYREKLLTLPTSKQTSFDPSLVNYRKLNDYKDNTSYRLSYGDKEIGTFTDYKDNPRTPEEWQDVVKRRFAGDPTLGIKPLDTENYRSSHWDEPNILAHIRMNDRNVEGKNALHIEEIQSDAHQTAREQGYRPTAAQKQQLEVIENKLTSGLSEGDIGNPDMDAVLKTAVDKKVVTPEEAKNYKQWSKGENSPVPDMPFKKTWLDLALKRVIREAAESGKDRISWTPGEAQAARYDLSKHIKRVELTDNSSGGIGRPKMEGPFEHGMLHAYDHNGKEVLSQHINSEKEIADHIGKEAAEKLMNVKPVEARSSGFGVRSRKLVDQDLKVGGEGMHYFYDKMLPAALEKLTGQKMKVGDLGQIHRDVRFELRKSTTRNKYLIYDRDLDKYLENSKLYNKDEAQNIINSHKDVTPVNYIDLPQSVKDVALHKGFPLFSSGLMLNPVSGDPFKKSKFKLVPVTSEPKFK